MMSARVFFYFRPGTFRVRLTTTANVEMIIFPQRVQPLGHPWNTHYPTTCPRKAPPSS